jgi:hypothetical protein
MLSRRARISLRWGVLIGGIHLVAMATLATFVVADQSRGSSQELWVLASYIDLPLNVACLFFVPLLQGIDGWPRVPFLPGIAGEWNKFLFPVLLYGVVGTAFWFVLGCGFGNLLARGRQSVDHARI